MFLEIEKICGTERLRQSTRQAWALQWAPKILEQAEREKGSNSRLRSVMDGVDQPSGMCQ